jgi:hypothetical protein
MIRVLVRATFPDQNAGGTGAQGCDFLLNYPTYWRNFGGTFAQAASLSSSFANEQKLFDEYKVEQMKVKYLPFYQAAGASVTTTAIDPTLISLQDTDDATNLTTYNKALNSQHSSFGIQSVFHESIFTVQVMKQQDAFNELKWLNSQSPSPSSPDAVNPAQQASVKIWRNGYGAAATSTGVFLVEWDVVWRGVYSAQ